MTHSVRFVLFETSHPGNIGAAARAIKTMGFSELVLVSPRQFPDIAATARASGATDVLDNARVVSSLAEAVEGCGLVMGCSARHRKLEIPEWSPREATAEIRDSLNAAPVAVVFGTEKSGLSNTELDLCNALVYIPSNPNYSSLNLAMAVQVLAYEISLGLQLGEGPQNLDRQPVGAEEMEEFYAHFERVLLATEFLDPDRPRHLMRRLRRLFNRARMDRNEFNIMRGVLNSIVPGSASAPKDDGESAG